MCIIYINVLNRITHNQSLSVDYDATRTRHTSHDI